LPERHKRKRGLGRRSDEGESMKFNCVRCENTGWVCGLHPELAKDHLIIGGQCDGVGQPCPICNTGDPPYPEDLRRHISGEYIDE
jgi:hypothetical protein